MGCSHESLIDHKRLLRARPAALGLYCEDLHEKYEFEFLRHRISRLGSGPTV